MARTAPVPNIPPIPGMCPSIAVMGGGAGGGGGGGDGAGDGDGSGAADGDGNGDAASGDGRNGGTGCGDPVCPITGRVFVDVLDFAFGGPFPFRFVRSYSSRTSHRWGELGHGWSHTLGFRLRVMRRSFIVIDDHGLEQRFDGALEAGEEVKNPIGLALGVDPAGYYLKRPSLPTVRFGPDVGDGTHLTAALVDRNGNTIAATRDPRGVLTGIVDSAGRQYHVRADQHGRLLEIAVALDPSLSAWMGVVRYEYDEAGNLSSATDAEGFSYRCAYAGHLLVEHRAPTGLSYCYRYDGGDHSAYCVETWGEYIGRTDPALEPPIAPRPQDKDTRKVKGIHYARLHYDKATRVTEVENGLGGVERYFGDAQARIVKHVTFAGAVFNKQYDPESGALVSYTDERGQRTMVTRDPAGGAAGVVSATTNTKKSLRAGGSESEVDLASGGETLRHYDANGNELTTQHPDGTVEHREYDGRGLCTRYADRMGVVTFFDWDAMGNLVAIDRAGQKVEVSDYDYLGRRTSNVDEAGVRTEWTWDRRSDIVRKVHGDGSVIEIQRDGLRKPLRIVDGGRVTRYEYGGLGWVTRRERPDGTAIEMRYDVQGHVVLVKNARGQSFTQAFDHAGRWAGCVTFEGLKHAAKYDSSNRLAWLSGPDGKRTTCLRDALGRLTEAVLPGGASIALNYGPQGLASVDTGTIKVELGYDEMRRVIRDVQQGIETAVSWAGGELASAKTRGAPEVTWSSDTVGDLAQVTVGAQVLAVDRPSGKDMVTVLNDKLVLRRHFGPTHLLEWQAIAPLRIDVPLDATATLDDSKLVFWVKYRHDEAQVLRQEERSDGRTISYETSPTNQILRRTTFRGGTVIDDETVDYDADGSPRLPGVEYDELFRPVGWRGERLEYDALGRLSKRLTDAGAWTYAWDAADNLVEVRTPDRRVVLGYDGRGRRMRKRVYRGAKCERDIAYVFSNHTVLHEIDRITKTTRTYLRDNDRWATLGHIDTKDGVETPCLYALSPNDGIDSAWSVDGAAAWTADQTIYGDARIQVRRTEVSLRFANQFYDEDIGLSYNRFRWYDARFAAYTSPDPLLLRGTLNPHDYVSNPRFLTDPMGQAPRRPTSRPSPGSPGGPPGNHPDRPPRPGSTAAMDGDYMAGPGHWATNGDPAGPPGWINCPQRALTADGDWDNQPGDPAAGPGSIRDQIDAAGDEYGCHSCGTMNPGGPDAPVDPNQHWVPDHVPPVSTYSNGTPRGNLMDPRSSPRPGSVRLYPQCKQCSNSQGGLASHETDADRRRQRRAGTRRNRANPR